MSKNLDIEITGLEILDFCIRRSSLNRIEATEIFMTFPIVVKQQLFKDLKKKNIGTIKTFFDMKYGIKNG